jgi:hypothetical protein
MSGFLVEKFGKDVWSDLRKNSKSVESFVRACWHKVDGLRILQFLKSEHQETEAQDELNLKAFFEKFYPEEEITEGFIKSEWDFKNATVEQLDQLRNFLFKKESQWRKQINTLR